MLSDKLNKIINSQIAKSTQFWAGKPKLNEEELSAVASFAKKKGAALDKLFSSEEEKQKLEKLFKIAISPKK